MNRLLRLSMTALVLCAFLSPFGNLRAAEWHTVRSVPRTLEVDGVHRFYRIYAPPSVPADKPAPLVLVFHGGGGTARGTERLTGFSDLADRDGFIVVYPDGIGRSWNDGRDSTVSRAHRDGIDDVRFVGIVIDTVAKEHRIDPKRIFATGISNGAIFSHYLAANLSTRIAAIAPVVGGIAAPFDERFKPERPVSVLIFQGTQDPLVPFDGGDVAGHRRGKIISTADTVKKWVAHDGCTEPPRTETLPDTDAADGCRVDRSTWSSCRDGTEVTLYALRGAGHTWPGGAQYLPESWIGKVCRDINATDIVWEFFKRHPKP